MLLPVISLVGLGLLFLASLRGSKKNPYDLQKAYALYNNPKGHTQDEAMIAIETFAKYGKKEEQLTLAMTLENFPETKYVQKGIPIR